MVRQTSLTERRDLVAAEPNSATAWLELGTALSDAGESGEALTALDRASLLDPRNPAPYRAQAAAYRAAGRQTEALATDMAAMALEARSPVALYNLATAYFMAGQLEPAAKWYRLTLALDPDFVAANQNLAAILDSEGRGAEAREHRDRAFRTQCLFIEPATTPDSTAPGPARRVLILSTSGAGNVPIEALFPPATTTRLKWFIEYATAEQAETLPDHDLVFNAIGDADMADTALEHAAHFVAAPFVVERSRPVVNRPASIVRTQRHLMPDLLTGIGDVVVPPVIRRTGAITPAILAEASLPLPILVRPVGAHGGADIVRIDAPETLDRSLAVTDAGACYITAYHDYRSADGFYRKYRMIFIDRRPFAYHLAISRHWLVHYFSADMLSEPWKRDEERRFFDDPAGVLGPRAMRAIEAIGRRLDLDFCGIDFGLLADGRVLVFEANATMAVHLDDPIEQFPYKHEHVPKIFEAFEAMLRARIAATGLQVGSAGSGSIDGARPEAQL
ncbi:MAG TPA: hypothetical protein VNT30_20200 [Stellaceae bacterium]|nr:hypothetical protein [Stellaceae bacterium]